MKNSFYLLCALCVVLTASCSKEEPTTTDLVTNGLVGYWSFDGNFLDGSGNEIDGVNNGTTFTSGINGNDESAIELNGNLQYVEIPHSEKINFEANDEYTISVWVAVPLNQSDMGGAENDVLSKWQSLSVEDLGYSISFKLRRSFGTMEEQLMCFRRWDNACGSWGTVNELANNDNNFSHYLFRYSDQLLEMFINGELVDFEYEYIPLCETKNDSPLYVGIRNPTTDNKFAFEGKIDELRIYDRAITDSEVEMLSKE